MWKTCVVSFRGAQVSDVAEVSVSFANYFIDLNTKICHVSKVRNMYLQYIEFYLLGCDARQSGPMCVDVSGTYSIRLKDRG
jgi:hypothetical protein